MHRREQSEIQEKEIDKQDYVQVAASKPSSSSVFRGPRKGKKIGPEAIIAIFFLFSVN
jgi:hypothetical protein